jgi:hypothetical protein
MTFDCRLFSGITVLAAVTESGSFVRAADAHGTAAHPFKREVDVAAAAELFGRKRHSPVPCSPGRL